jgi:hypothetical protein
MAENRIAVSEHLLPLSEVARQLRVPSSWVYGHAEALGVIRVGKYLRFAWPRVMERLDQACQLQRAVGPPAQRPIPSGTKEEICNALGTDGEPIDKRRF